MRNITLLCNIPLVVAVNAARARYGIVAVPFTDEDVGALSDDARALVASATDIERDGKRGLGVKNVNDCFDDLDVDDATPEAARAALEVLATKRAEKAAMAAADYEDKVRRALAAPDEEWLVNREDPWAAPRLAPYWVGGVLLDSIRGDERVKSHIRYIEQQVLPPLVEAWNAKKAEEKRVAEAEKAEKERVKAEWEAKVRAYVIACVPEYARAAVDGRDVARIGEKAAERYVEGALEKLIESHSLAGEPLRCVREWTDRAARMVPTAHAYAARDALKTIVAKFLDDAPPELRAVLGEPEFDIERMTAEEEGEADKKFTCATVYFDVGSRAVDVAVLAEEPGAAGESGGEEVDEE